MAGYEIDDYKTKTELTREKLESTLIAGLRTVGFISEIEGLNEQLRHQQKLTTIGEFCMGIMHEIATPLSTILCISELMQEKTASVPGPSDEYVNKIQRASLRIKRLIDTLKALTWTGPEAKTPRAGAGASAKRHGAVPVQIDEGWYQPLPADRSGSARLLLAAAHRASADQLDQ